MVYGGIKIKKSGFLYAIVSALIFGAMPVFAKGLYKYGCDSMSSAFYRMSLSLVVVFFIAKVFCHIDMSLTKKSFLDFLIASAGFMMTSVTLYNSYNYISAGAATSIHFIYPVIIVIAVSILTRTLPTIIEVICVIASTCGIALITDFSQMSNLRGVIFAILSSFAYAFYNIFLEKSSISKENPIKILFYTNAFGAVMIFCYAMFFGDGIAYKFTPIQWRNIFLFSLVITVGAALLFQQAIRKIGAKYTSILSTLEPIVSIVMGFLVLKEDLTIKQIMAVALIFISSFMLVIMKGKGENTEKVCEQNS